MTKKIGILIAQLLMLFMSKSCSFNLNIDNPIHYEGQERSMFGYSVALHKENNRTWIIIGAPNARTSMFQDGVNNGGVVYQCEPFHNNHCSLILFDEKGNNKNENDVEVDTKSNQWFGATVASAGIDGPIVACAPRYVYHTNKPNKIKRNEPVGTCWTIKDNINFHEIREYSPCRTVFWGYHRQGSCQAGFSVALSKDGNRLFVGTPGSRYFQGQVYSINNNLEYPFKPTQTLGAFGDETINSTDPKDRVYSTKEGSSDEDDTYMGYSTITGDFNGDGLQDVAVGMPRGADLLGKVLIYSWDLVSQKNITGEQIGAYFGYSLCSVDVDGDKLDDLIVGAPMHTTKNNEGKYENGMVYIIYQGRTNKFAQFETREGERSKGRFGLSLASLGDINLDGYGDFAVGAPYDGPNGRGAVYVFHGSKDGVLPKASQVIFAEDVKTLNLRTFGFSLAGGIDLDGNQYPDMVVGAYESDIAVRFLSHPVISTTAHIAFESENKKISLNNKNCTLNDGKKVSCVTLTSCFKYNGTNLPVNLAIEVFWTLDSMQAKSPRLFFLNSNGNSHNQFIELSNGKEICTHDDVYVSDEIKDELTPLEVEMKFQIIETPQEDLKGFEANSDRKLRPVQDQNREKIYRDRVEILKD